MPGTAVGKQPRFCRKVVGHALVVVEMVAAQVREDRGIDTYAVDAPLSQRMRRDFDGRVAGALFDKLGEAFVHFDDGRRRHTLAALQFAQPMTQRAEVRALLAKDLRGLSNHPGDSRLAVGARHADHFELFRWTTVEAVRNLTEPGRKPVHGDERNANVGWRRSGRGVPCHSSDSRLERLSEKIEAVRRQPLHREEQVTVVESPAVAADATHGHRRRIGKTLQQVGERRLGMHVFGRHAHWRSVRVAIACMTLSGSRTGSASGGTASSRSDSDMTSEKTGAATSLP